MVGTVKALRRKATGRPAAPLRKRMSEVLASPKGTSERGEHGGDARLKRLTTLLEVARMLTAELDLSEIVHQVLVRAIAVIPAADAGTLYLEDKASGRLV